MTDLHTFLDELSSAAPVPGGGSVAALEAAMAAALLAMVANLTLGRKKYASAQDRARFILAESVTQRDRALQLVEEDVAAYRSVSDALALPRDTETQKVDRTRQLQAALKAAAQPPLETARVAERVVGLAKELVAIGNRSAISDVGTAAQAALAGYYGAKLNVEINAASVTDGDWVRETMSQFERIGDPSQAVATVMELVRSSIRGDAV